MEELQRWAQKFAKRHCGEGEFEENVVQTAVLKRWRQKLSVALQKGNAAIFAPAWGAKWFGETPNHLTRSLYRGHPSHLLLVFSLPFLGPP